MPNDVNLVLGKTATASSSVAPYTPNKAVNGNKTGLSERWLAYKSPGWLMVDLLVPCVISRWAVYLLPNATPTTWPVAQYGMKAYTLQVSMDGVNWTNADSVSGNNANFTDRNIPTTAIGRFVRVSSNTGLNGNAQAMSLLEFEAYGHAVSADLVSLVSSAGALTPAFSPTTIGYTQPVGFDTTTVALTPTVADPSASVTVNGVRVASGAASAPINLVVGNNAIPVVVTPVYGAAKTYTVTVARADSQYLTSLTLKSGANTYALTPPFSKTSGSYTVNVPYDASTVTVTPVAEGTTSVINVNGAVVASGAASAPIAMNVGANTPITVECSLPSGVKQTYTITVTRADSSYLSTLTIKPGTLVPAFASTTLEYALDASGRPSVKVTPVAQSSSATMAVNGTQVTSAAPTVTVALASGPNRVEVIVANGSVIITYVIVVTG